MPTIVCPLWKIVNGLLIYQNYQRWCAQASFYKLRITQIINCEFPQANYQLQIYRVIKDGMHSRLKWNYWSDWLKKNNNNSNNNSNKKTEIILNVFLIFSHLTKMKKIGSFLLDYLSKKHEFGEIGKSCQQNV